MKQEMKANYRIEMDRSCRALTWMIFVNDTYRMDFCGERAAALDKAKQLALQDREWNEACAAWLEQEHDDRVWMENNQI